MARASATGDSIVIFHKRSLTNVMGTKNLSLEYPFSPPPCFQGLASSIVRASHRCVGSIPTQTLRFFRNLGTCMQVLLLIVPRMLIYFSHNLYKIFKYMTFFLEYGVEWDSLITKVKVSQS